MAFPTGWSRRVAIVIDYTKVGSGGVSDFDVALTRDCLPDEMCSPSDGNAAQSDGGDVRFSSDSAGSTQLACDVIRFEHDTSDAAGDADVLIRVLVPSVSSASDTTIYAWYKTGSTESQPAASDTYGSDNAYDSSVKAYWPMEEDPSGSAPQTIDRTSNNNDGTSAGSMTSGDLVAGKISSGVDLDGSNDQISVGDSSSLSFGNGSTDSPFSVSFWIDWTSDSYGGAYGGVMEKGGDSNNREWAAYVAGGSVNFALYDDNGGARLIRYEGTPSLSSGTFKHVYCTYDGSKTNGGIKVYVNGSRTDDSTNDLGTYGAMRSTGSPLLLGYGFNGGWIQAIVDEQRIEAGEASAAWITTRYNNESDAGAFAVPGTPESMAVAIKIPWHLFGRVA